MNKRRKYLPKPQLTRESRTRARIKTWIVTNKYISRSSLSIKK